MSYKRKTTDIYEIYVNYGQGWEHETTELSYRELKEQVKAYRENCNYPVKWRKKREKITN